jgi:ferrochelatase
MAYGGPDSLAELPGYLADIRGGRVTNPEVLSEMKEHYRQIGGRSPLLEITERQVESIRKGLGEQFRCYLGMRHWHPWLEETVGAMVADGIQRAVSLVLAPHYSAMSVGRYLGKIEDGLRMYHGEIEFRHITSYHRATGLIEALAHRVTAGIERFSPADRDQVHIVFSAHSLPERILEQGDPYDTQLRETAALVAAAAEVPSERWSWSYQSAGKSPEPWLGPQLEEHLPELAARGIRKVVSVPVGFVGDHVEILYDIDIEAQAVAKQCGIELVRPAALNDDPKFIDALISTVRERAGDWLGTGSGMGAKG